MFGDVHPSLTDILHYNFCHVGILVGPYYKFRTYLGMFCDPWNPVVSGVDTGPLLRATWTKFRLVPLWAVAYLVLGEIWDTLQIYI